MDSKQNLVARLKQLAPLIYDLTLTELGYEFSAIGASGVIFPEPGMLLSTSYEGQLPEELKEGVSELSEEFYSALFSELSVVPFENLTQEELEQILSQLV